MPPSSPWGTKPNRNNETENGHFVGSGIFWLSGIIVISILAAVGYYFLRPQGVNVGMSFSKPDQVLLGDPFVYSISVSNYSDAVLKSAKVSILLPDTVSFVGQPTGQRVMEQTIGDVGPGSINKIDFNLIATQSANAITHFQAKLIYSTNANPGSHFEYPQTADVLVGGPAVTLNITAPQQVFSGQDFDVQFAYKNNTTHAFNNIHFKVDYPPIFSFKQSTVLPEDAGHNSWNLGNLPANSEGTITVSGNAVGQEQSSFQFNGTATADFSGVTYPINQQSVNLAISASPLSLAVSLAAGNDVVLHPGDPLDYTITYRNNSGVPLQNVSLTAALRGEMFDLSHLQSNGAFDSLTNILSWSPANNPPFLNLAPGMGGSVTFHAQVKTAFPVHLLSDKNYSLKVNAQINSPTVPSNTTADRTVSVVNLENKVAGQLTLSAEAYWRDAASGILNSGPYPPKVNQPTQYTIHWIVTTAASDIQSLVVSAYLQSGARFTGKVWSNNGVLPAYDSNSGFVSWNVGSVAANKGILGAPLEAIFQIEVTPAVNQLNQNVVFLGTTKAQGDDLFSGGQVFVTAPQLDSSLPYDKTITVADRAVKN